MEPVYLDYNATTPLDREVIMAMQPFLSDIYGNPSSLHSQGSRARLAVEKARSQVAGMLNCRPDEIIFTSGGTESNNMAIKGVARSMRHLGNHIITSAIEHPSVTEVCRYLEKEGFEVTYLPVDQWGCVDPEELEGKIRKTTILITVMHANNETGSLQPVMEVGMIAKRNKILFHMDAAQSCGKIRVDAEEIGADLISVAGHKLYAPKGTGALFIRRGTTLEKLIHGADHEQNLRAGTENVMSVAGLGKACEIVSEEMEEYRPRIKKLTDYFYDELKKSIPSIRLNGHPEKRLPNTLNLGFPGADANLLLSRMEGIAASAGAACHSGDEAVSPVLSAMNVPLDAAMGAIRFSTGKMTTEEEIRRAVKVITGTYAELYGKIETGSKKAGQESSKIRLTTYTHSLGCACKIRPQVLENILKELPRASGPDILVDMTHSDDAAAYRINDSTAILQTVDFIPPVIDDPYAYGQIAAANALSDIYAMGGEPIFALSIVGFPITLLPVDVLRMILKGAADKVAEAGIAILGGHTVEETEPKFGLVVTGRVHPGSILTNSGSKPGDLLVLTKPIGTGILSTAMKNNLLSDEEINRLTGIMSQLNKKAAGIMAKYRVNACTDITGFGLLGHLKEMTTGSGTGAAIGFDHVPLIDRAMEMIAANMIPGGSRNNLAWVEDTVIFEKSVSESEKLILADAQTSGGLLISLPEENAVKLTRELHKEGIPEASVIGKITGETGKIRVARNFISS